MKNSTSVTRNITTSINGLSLLIIAIVLSATSCKKEEMDAPSTSSANSSERLKKSFGSDVKQHQVVTLTPLPSTGFATDRKSVNSKNDGENALFNTRPIKTLAPVSSMTNSTERQAQTIRPIKVVASGIYNYAITKKQIQNLHQINLAPVPSLITSAERHAHSIRPIKVASNGTYISATDEKQIQNLHQVNLAPVPSLSSSTK